MNKENVKVKGFQHGLDEVRHGDYGRICLDIREALGCKSPNGYVSDVYFNQLCRGDRAIPVKSLEAVDKVFLSYGIEDWADQIIPIQTEEEINE